MRRNRMQALVGGGRRGEFRVSAALVEPGVAVSGVNEMWIYDFVDPYADEYWGGVSASMVVAAMQSFADGPVLVHVNSPGGDVFEALAIYSTIRQHRGDVTIRVEGVAASAASVIMMAGNRCEIDPNAMVMIHDASTFEYGNAAAMHKTAGLLDQTSNNMAGMYHTKAGAGTVASWRALMEEETWYVGEEAVAAGLVDAIATVPGVPASADGMAARWDLSVFAKAPTGSRPSSTVPDTPVQPAPTSSPPFVIDDDLVESLRMALREVKA